MQIGRRAGRWTDRDRRLKGIHAKRSEEEENEEQEQERSGLRKKDDE